MADKSKLKALRHRIKQDNDALEAEILRSEERLSALKSLLADRKGQEIEIGAICDDIP